MKGRHSSIAAKHDQSPLATTGKRNSLGSFHDEFRQAGRVTSQMDYSHTPQVKKDSYKGGMQSLTQPLQQQPAGPRIKFSTTAKSIGQRNQKSHLTQAPSKQTHYLTSLNATSSNTRDQNQQRSLLHTIGSQKGKARDLQHLLSPKQQLATGSMKRSYGQRKSSKQSLVSDVPTKLLNPLHPGRIPDITPDKFALSQMVYQTTGKPGLQKPKVKQSFQSVIHKHRKENRNKRATSMAQSGMKALQTQIPLLDANLAFQHKEYQQQRKSYIECLGMESSELDNTMTSESRYRSINSQYYGANQRIGVVSENGMYVQTGTNGNQGMGSYSEVQSPLKQSTNRQLKQSNNGRTPRFTDDTLLSQKKSQKTIEQLNAIRLSPSLLNEINRNMIDSQFPKEGIDKNQVDKWRSLTTVQQIQSHIEKNEARSRSTMHNRKANRTHQINSSSPQSQYNDKRQERYSSAQYIQVVQPRTQKNTNKRIFSKQNSQDGCNSSEERQKVKRHKTKKRSEQSYFDKKFSQEETKAQKRIQEVKNIFHIAANVDKDDEYLPRQLSTNDIIFDMRGKLEHFKQQTKELEAQKKEQRHKELYAESMVLGKELIEARIENLNVADDMSDMWSDSDASDHRRDQLQIEMENQVMTRLHTAFKVDDLQKLKMFKHNRLEKMSKPKRDETLTRNMIKWIKDEKDTKTEEDQADKSFSPVKYKQSFKLATTELHTLDIDKKALRQRQKKRLKQALTSELAEQYQKIDDEIQNKKGIVSNLMQNFNKQATMTSKAITVHKPHKFLQMPDQLEKPDSMQLVGMDKKRTKIQHQKLKGIVKQLNNYEMCQNRHRDVLSKLLKNDPDHVYFKHVDSAQEVNLPLISKVIDNKLVLMDYTLDSGHLGGLAQVFESGAMQVDAVLFDNCGIDDQELAILIQGFCKLKTFEHFVYKNNMFKEQGLEAMQQLLWKRSPENLQGLRLVNCITSSKIMSNLVEFMLIENVQLSQLALVNMQLNKISLGIVSQFIEESQYLEKLDLSWNNLLPNDFAVLFDVLAKNVTLKTLNLSCNTIIDKQYQNNKSDFNFNTAFDQYVEQKKEAVQAGSTQIKTEINSKELPIKAIQSFGRLIRYNKVLQSLILNNCGLNSQVICGFIPYMRHAKSLVCLHMASNPGITESVEKFYRERLKIQPETMFKIQVQPEYLGELTVQEMQILSPRAREVRKHKVKHYRQWKTEEIHKYLNTRRIKPLLSTQDANFITDTKDLTITRILGQKKTMPGLGRWKLQTVKEPDTCWACDNWIYTLYFWNEKIGQYDDNNFISIDADAKVQMANTIRQYNLSTYKDNPQVPVLFCPETDWQPQPFMKILDFLDLLEPAIMPPFEGLVMNDVKSLYKVEDLSQIPEEKQQEVQDYMANRKEEMKEEWLTIRYNNTSKIIHDKLEYKKPALINYDKLDGSMGDVYVIAIFQPPSKNDFLIRTPIDLETQKKVDAGKSVYQHEYQREDDLAYRWYYRRHMSEIRQEEIKSHAKELKLAIARDQFLKHLSIFKDWKEDNDEIIKECLSHDLRYWKVKKMVTNEEYEAILQIIKGRYRILKDIFLQQVVECMAAPDFLKREFFGFCTKAGIIDQKMHSGIIDTYFKATNFEEEDQDNNDDFALNRFEFLEILVRIAKGKFVEFGKEKTVSYALMKLMQTHILPMHATAIPIQSWRDQELWTTEVADMLEVNLRPIKKVYQFIACQQFYKNKNRVEDIDRNTCSIDQIRDVLKPLYGPMNLNDDKIVQAFFLSKMTCAQETVTSNVEYTYLYFPEFLEFIGRSAQLKYRYTHQNTNWTLSKKIKVILIALFTLVNETYIEPPELVDIPSESDDDY